MAGYVAVLAGVRTVGAAVAGAAAVAATDAAARWRSGSRSPCYVMLSESVCVNADCNAN